MKVSGYLSAAFLFVGAIATALELPAGVPRSIDEFRDKHPYRSPCDPKRPRFTIRASDNDLDDVSSEFYDGLKQANKGGTLYLPKGKTYIIGKPLDLTWLDDIHVHLEGEIKFTNDTAYWQKNSFAHPFQVSFFMKDMIAKLG
jgi:galacturan 1,4-alpha-galacturonidase